MDEMTEVDFSSLKLYHVESSIFMIYITPANGANATIDFARLAFLYAD